MSEPRFDTEAVFGEDYLYFYESFLTDERSDRETDAIWRLLELGHEMSVLDLACGHGRIANRLAARGCRVTGLDVTRSFLERARADAAGQGLEVEYVQGDMRSLPWVERFDAVLIWFTSFGYFDDEDNRRVLEQCCRVLKPGGRLVIENNNLAAILGDFQAAHVLERDGDLMIDRSRFDPGTSRILSERIVVRDGDVRRSHFFVRAFMPTELRAWLLAAGFASVDVCESGGEELRFESRRMITLARR